MPSFFEHFSSLPDPRVERTRAHRLVDIFAIALCAVLCGAEGWDAMASFGRSKEAWLRTFLTLPHGIPCADTFRRVLSRLDPEALGRCFTAWMHEVAKETRGELIAIDGKTLRRSFDQAEGIPALHLVNAWARGQRLLLGQVATAEKSNEITAIPRLLGMLQLEGAVVTLDAMGCQKKIATTIVLAKAEYVIACKGNQDTLHQQVESFFNAAGTLAFLGTSHDVHVTEEKGHGRHEVRRVWSSEAVHLVPATQAWPTLRTMILVQSERTVAGVTSRERRYYISSLSGKTAAELGDVVRGHWSVENELHWVLDVAFREDESRIRKDHGPENVGLLRKLSLNMLKRDKTLKLGIANKRLQLGWNDTYLARVLAAGLPQI